ncbi:MAG: UPF0262 family protein [Alphaproteobacteria bacterium]|nr:UPF0262 family protein [Alphaproteobacteria bacterium]
MDKRQHLVSIRIDERDVSRQQEAEQERQAAIDALLEKNSFAPYDEESGEAHPGPFDLFIRTRDNRLYLDVRAENGPTLEEVTVPLKPFKTIIRDYFMICDSYYAAIQAANSSRIEAIDMGRRGMHNEGAELLTELLAPRVTIDFDTARRLFTLLCALHVR